MIETQKYVKQPLIVDAVRITNGNFEDIADWCQGDILHDEGSKKYIKVRVHNPKNPRQTKAFAGDWLLYTERGYKVYTNKAFLASFDLVDESAIEEKKYPFQDGDFTVLGPEIFTNASELVICWKGEHFIRQSQPDEFVEATPQNIAQAVLANDEARIAEEDRSQTTPVANSKPVFAQNLVS